MMDTLLSTKELCRSFKGVKALSRVNLEFRSKGLKSIIGPNGAGKTTLVNVITGRFPASSGAIIYLNREVTKRCPHQLCRMGISRTFQITSIFAGLTVFENVRIAKQTKKGGSLRILSSRQSLKQVNEATWDILELTGLSDFGDTESGNLSHGDHRLLEIAMALANEPRILFLDEPTAGMSPAETQEIAQLIKKLAKDISIVLIEHDMDVVMAISNEITVLNQGMVFAEGSPEEIQTNDKVREVYLGD
jgi:branched-chain amino acid transport system ATP-binding protein